MSELSTAIVIDLVGWLLWFVLTRQLAQGKAERWITVDYYISTVCLTLSTLSTSAAVFLTEPVLVTRIAVPLVIIGVGVAAVRGVRTAASRRVEFATAAPTASPRPAPRQWRTVTTVPAGAAAQPAVQPVPAWSTSRTSIFNDPLIMDIESRRM